MYYSNTRQRKKQDLSVIVPLYNEEESVALLYEKIAASVQPLDLDYEILFVDDGSVDYTIPESSKITARDTRLRVIKFRRNYGQTPAMAAGIDHARGEYLITMDGDLQNDTDDIPGFLEKPDEGKAPCTAAWRIKDDLSRIHNYTDTEF